MFARSLAAAVFALVATSAAHAVAISAAGDAFEVDFDGNLSGEPAAGLTASARFLVTRFDAAEGRVVLEITLTNTTDTRYFHGARVSALGFDVDAPLPEARASGLFENAVVAGQFPNGFGPIDVCASSQPNNCSGGRKAGVRIGQSGVLTLELDFDGPLESLELTNFGVRYQSVNARDCLPDDSGTGHGTPSVPEPRAFALLGVAGLAWFGRKRRA